MSARDFAMETMAGPGALYTAELTRKALHDDWQEAGQYQARLKGKLQELRCSSLEPGESWGDRYHRIDLLEAEISAAGTRRRNCLERLQGHEQMMESVWPE